MRIPSQFNEDSLYRRGRRVDDSAQTYRRLIRLVIGLALVVVVMQQAARPEIYRTFFGQPTASRPEVRDSASSGTPELAAHVIDPDDRGIANQLVNRLSPEDQRPWVVALSQWESGRKVESIPTSAPDLLEHLQALEGPSDASRRSWDAMFESLFKSAQLDPVVAPAANDRPRIAALLAALDDAASSRVVDGSVWRSGDFDALYRYLDQADSLSETHVARTGVLPLLQQPDVFRNQLVRTDGGVARVEQIEARENPYGITHYWQLWLRPSDGADRPIVAIVPSAPSHVAGVGADAIVEEGPQVTIVGRFLKRLAYESSVGADLAPVVVGRISSAPLAQIEPAAESPSSPSLGSNRMWLIAAGGLLGLALAALAMWRTAVAANRARHLRTANRKRPDEFLGRLQAEEASGDSIAPSRGN